MLVRPPGSASADGDECPFCPGNERLTPPETACYRKDGAPANSGDWSVRAIPERDPYFRIELPLLREGVGLYDKITPRGATELIVESPRHDDTPATMPEAQWEQVLWMYGERIRDLKRDLAIRDILVTRRHRIPRARASRIPTPVSPPSPSFSTRAGASSTRRATTTATSIAASTATSSGRSWPTASGWCTRRSGSWSSCPMRRGRPFETWILPRQHAAAYEDALSGDLVADLARVLGRLLPDLRRRVWGTPPWRWRSTTPPIGPPR